jgi:hypothetical protein
MGREIGRIGSGMEKEEREREEGSGGEGEEPCS